MSKNVYGFGSKNRMKSAKQITALFKQHKSVFVHPVKCLYNLKPNQESKHSKILITVPKRNFKSAVKRNKIKRIIREAYRLQKPHVERHLKEKQLSVEVAFIYLGKDIIRFNKMQTVIEKLMGQIIIDK